MRPSTITDKPWGFEKIWAFSNREDGYVGKIIHIKDGHRLSLQKHEEKEETILVMNGTLELVLENGTLYLSEGDFFHITPGLVHRFSANDGDCTLVEVSTKELDDVIRLEDDYGR